MPDRGYVIERLGRVSYYFKSLLAVGWQGDADTYKKHMESVNMAIAMLREQEAVRPSLSIFTPGMYSCGDCGEDLPESENGCKPNYCPNCGREVKWE